MVHVPKQKRKKWSRKSIGMKFMGYCEETKGFRIFDVRSNSITKSNDVEFLENSFENICNCDLSEIEEQINNILVFLDINEQPEIDEHTTDTDVIEISSS